VLERNGTVAPRVVGVEKSERTREPGRDQPMYYLVRHIWASTSVLRDL
jgi:hypothetical protein